MATNRFCWSVALLMLIGAPASYCAWEYGAHELKERHAREFTAQVDLCKKGDPVACDPQAAGVLSLDVDRVVVASTGHGFFRGSDCGSGCGTYAVGYRWADNLHKSTGPGSCARLAPALRNGCAGWYSDHSEDPSDGDSWREVNAPPGIADLHGY